MRDPKASDRPTAGTPSGAEASRPVRPRGVAAHTFALGVSTSLATVLQGAATLALTKLLTTGAFGAWRKFVLFTTFVGLLHVGLADGLQVAWCTGVKGRSAPTVRTGVRRLMQIQACWLVAGIGASILAPSLEPFPFFFGVAGLFALVWNLSTVLQFRAQCRERFIALSGFVALYPATFLACVALLLVSHTATPLHLAIGVSVGALLSSLAFLVHPADFHEATNHSAPTLGGRETIRVGLPILALNNASIGMGNFDKLAASFIFAPPVFATYAFASVLVVFIGSFITAGSRVLLPALARHATRGTLERAAITSTRTIVQGWGIALVGYFPAAALVARIVPQYVPALPMARWLFLAALFQAVPQIVHVNSCRAIGAEGRYVRGTWYLVGAALVAALLGGRFLGMAVLPPLSWTAAVAWTVGGALLLRREGVRSHDSFAVGATIWFTLCFALTTSKLGLLSGAGVYALAAAPVVGFSFLGRRSVRVG